MKAVDRLFAARADEIRAETLLQQVAARWGRLGEPSKQTEETIRAGADREFRAWTAAIVTEGSLESFLAAPDNLGTPGQ